MKRILVNCILVLIITSSCSILVLNLFPNVAPEIGPAWKMWATGILICCGFFASLDFAKDKTPPAILSADAITKEIGLICDPARPIDDVLFDLRMLSSCINWRIANVEARQRAQDL
jgi:hypothetical protein